MAELTQTATAIDALESLRASAPVDGASGDHDEVYAAMIVFAAACLEREMVQAAADTLAFLLQEQDVSAKHRDEAAEIFDELESRICPRVILDARAFADGMDLLTMLEYLLDLIELETT